MLNLTIIRNELELNCDVQVCPKLRELQLPRVLEVFSIAALGVLLYCL